MRYISFHTYIIKLLRTIDEIIYIYHFYMEETIDQNNNVSSQQFYDMYNKLSSNSSKLNEDVSEIKNDNAKIKSDIEKLKGQMCDKIPMSVFTELEEKINYHTKAIDSTQKKLFEMQKIVNTVSQQPLSHTLIDTLKDQIKTEMLSAVQEMLDGHTTNMTQFIEEKNKETRNLINNAKKFMYH